MEEEALVDIAKACRLCLMNENDPEMYEIDDDIFKAIQTCSIKYFDSNDFPALICTNCHSILQFILKFHKMCENTVAYFNETYLVQEENIEIVTKRDPDHLDECIVDDVTISEDIQDNAEIITNDEIHEEIIEAQEEDNNVHLQQTGDVDDGDIADDEDVVNEEYIYEVNSDTNDQDEETDEKVGIDRFDEYERLESVHETNEESEEPLWIEYMHKQEEDALTVYILDKNNQLKEHEINKNKESPSQTLLRSKNNQQLPSKQHRIAGDSTTTTKLFSCEICGNKYRKMGALESHRRRHRNKKPYECEICAETFDYNFKLERHMRKHTGAKPFTCEYCDRKFVDRSTMSRHQKIHRNERAYSCTMCGKSFTYYSVLKTHIMSHTGEKPYACGICDKGFHRASDLKNHLETLQHRKDPRVPELLQNIRRKDEVTLHGFT